MMLLDEVEATAGNSATFTFVNIPTWAAGTRHIFVGVPTSQADINSLNVPTREEPVDFFARVFERYMPIVNVDSVPVKWWRTILPQDSPEEEFRQAYISGWGDAPGPPLSSIPQYAFIGSIFVEPTVAVVDYPTHTNEDEYAWVAGNSLATVLNSPNNRLWGEAIGAHGFIEAQALHLGIIINRPRSIRDNYYSRAIFDEYVMPMNDVELLVVVRYQVHDVYTRI